MDFKLNADQEMIQQLAKDFAEKNILPRIDEIGVDEKFPDDLYQQMVDAGLVGIAFDEKYGGAGLGYDCFVLAIEQIAKVSAAAAKAILITLLPLEGVYLFGTEEQKQRYIVPSMTGEVRGSMAFTEPETGSDPKQLTTIAKRDGDNFILNGTKRFISNSEYPGPILMYAKEADTGLCTGFMFDKFCPGYSISTPWKKVGLHGSPVFDIFVDNIKVPASDILGKSGDGFALLLETTSRGKLGFSALFLGTMLASYEAAVKYAKEKMHRGQPISKFQAIQIKIANIAANYESARWMLYKARTGCEQRGEPREVPGAVRDGQALHCRPCRAVERDGDECPRVLRRDGRVQSRAVRQRLAHRLEHRRRVRYPARYLGKLYSQ